MVGAVSAMALLALAVGPQAWASTQEADTPYVASVVGPRDASDGPLPPAVAQQIESVNEQTQREPDRWSGAWYDAKAQSVVIGIPKSRADSPEEAAGTQIVRVDRSFADLQKLVLDSVEDRDSLGVRVNGAYVDVANNRVIVVVDGVDSDAQRQFGAAYGEAVALKAGKPGTDAAGPDRWRDRFPYWGGAGIHRNGIVSAIPGCSTSFAVQRPNLSKKFVVTAGHCALPSLGNIQDAGTISSGTSWNNYIGTNTGYANSLCVTTGHSCDIGGTKYGDIAIYRVSGVDGKIWGGGSRGITSLNVVSTQTGLPAENTLMCTSGATNGNLCNFNVESNFSAFYTSSGLLRSPVVLTSNPNTCISPGDSGGAVYMPVSGSARASGTISGFGYGTVPCGMIYTSIFYAQSLFDVNTVLN